MEHAQENDSRNCLKAALPVFSMERGLPGSLDGCCVMVWVFHQHLIMVPGLMFAAIGKGKEHSFPENNEASI